MNSSYASAEQKALSFLKGDEIVSRLGAGVDGIVYSTPRPSAIKVFERERHYRQELAVYRRFAELKMVSVLGHAILRLISWDSDKWIIEMSTVKPPYVLDFAHAGVDAMPGDYAEQWDEWLIKQSEEFGEDWAQAIAIYRYLVNHCGVYYCDLRRRNIAF